MTAIVGDRRPVPLMHFWQDRMAPRGRDNPDRCHNGSIGRAGLTRGRGHADIGGHAGYPGLRDSSARLGNAPAQHDRAARHAPAVKQASGQAGPTRAATGLGLR